MTRKRLIDRISPTRDRVDVPNDWLWLMEPFIHALNLPPHEAATDAYTDIPSHRPALNYLELKLEAVLALGSSASDVKYNLLTLRSASRPILVVGEPGVGKTTWLLHFFGQDLIERSCYFYRFDGLSMVSAIVDTDHISYMRYALRSGIAQAMKEASARIGIYTAVTDLASDADVSQFAIEDAIRRSAADLAEAGQTGFVILDNLDRRPREVQEYAIEFAKNLCTLGLHAIVALRPYTLRPARAMDDIMHVTIPQPSITELLRQRVERALNSSQYERIVSQLKAGMSVSLSWTEGTIRSGSDLYKLYEAVAASLGGIGILTDHLCNIHLGDLHEITHDLVHLLQSGHFCHEMLRRLRHEGRSPLEFLTAYFRGAYHHHRHSHQSGNHIVNLYEAPASDRRNRFLLIRFLQFVRRYGNGVSVRVGEVCRRLSMFGYDFDRSYDAVRLLVGSRLLVEVRRMVDWQDPHLKLMDDDEVVLSESGAYYLDNLLCNTRYISAMADVTYIDAAVVDMDMRLIVRSVDDAFTNAFVLMSEVASTLEYELDRLSREGKLHEFLEYLDTTSGFVVPGVTACAERVRQLVSEGKLDSIQLEKWRGLQKRADAIRELKLKRQP